jgi:hypothetical protein
MPVSTAPARLRGDPLAGAVVQRRAAVQRRCHLETQPGPPAQHAREEADVQFARGLGQQAGLHRDAGAVQGLDAGAGHLRERVAHRHHHAGHAGLDERQHARRRAAMVGAGFQRHVHRGAARIVAAGAGVAQGHDLGMRVAGGLRVAAADDPPVRAVDDAAHARVGVGQADAVVGQRQRFVHGGQVGGPFGGQGVG